MRPEPNYRVDRYRILGHPLFPATPRGVNYGAFDVCLPTGARLLVLSSGLVDAEATAGLPDDCQDFEHVSVSHAKRCPTWEEMEFVRHLFWGPDETVVQIHPPASAKVNYHETCLHLWRDVRASVRVPGWQLLGPLKERWKK